MRELADLVAHLPHGCPLWLAAGGPLALSSEAHLLREAIFRLEVIDWHNAESKGPAPKRIELPRPAAEVKAEQAQQNAKAQRWAARQARQSATT